MEPGFEYRRCDPTKWRLSCPFYRWRDSSSERLSNMSEVTQLIGDLVRTGIQFGLASKQVLFFLPSLSSNNYWVLNEYRGFPGGSVIKNSPANAGDMGLTPGLGRSPGEGNATHSGILVWKLPWTEEPVHGFAKSQTRLRDWTFTEYRDNYLGRGFPKCPVYQLPWWYSG